MRTLSLDLRERILLSYDREEGTRAEIAGRFRVSLGMVKKLLQQRRRTGDIAPRHRFAGRKPMIVGVHPAGWFDRLHGLGGNHRHGEFPRLRGPDPRPHSAAGRHRRHGQPFATQKRPNAGPDHQRGSPGAIPASLLARPQPH